MPDARSTTARGYGTEHQAERERWRPVVEAGQAECSAITCLADSRHIEPDEPWDLDHNEDRTGYRGPAHARCNRAAGGRNSRHRAMTIRSWGDPA